MTHQARIRYADDWRIVRKEIASIGVVVGVGLEEYIFKSPSLHYRATFYLPKCSIGASIGVKVSAALSLAMGQTNSQLDYLRTGNDDWRVLRRFPLNDLVGGSIRLGTVGTTTGIVGGNGLVLKIFDNRGINVASYEGGSFGAGLGAEVNLGRAAIGALLGPYNEV